MTRQWWLGVVVVFTLTSVLLARDGIIKTKDGRTISGDIDETSSTDNVSITIHGAKISLPKSSIASIEYTGDFDKQYQDRMGASAADDAKGRIEVAKWAFDNKQYEAARQAALEAQKIDPNNQDAASLLATIQATLAQESRAGSNPTPAAPPAPAAGGATDTTPAGTPPAPKYLSDDQINRIRQVELQQADGNIRISFANNVTQRYLSSGGHDAQAFMAQSAAGQALEILQNNPELGKDIKVLTDPLSLLQFRTKIQPRVLAGCAASGCHSGPKGGDFFLYANADQLAATYTNFYILQTYAKKMPGGPSVFGGGDVLRGTIDRGQPSQSLLIQYGMPPQAAITPHPDAKDWKPTFMSDQDAGYQQLITWMGTTLKPFVTDYGFKFDLPTGKPTTEPSPAP